MIRVSSLNEKKITSFVSVADFPFLHWSFKKDQELKILKPRVENAFEILYIIVFFWWGNYTFLLIKTMQEYFFLKYLQST